MSDKTDIINSFNDLINIINGRYGESIQNYVTEDNKLNDEFKNKVKDAVNKSFTYAGKIRSNTKKYGDNGPVSSSLTEITKERQYELINDYLDTILNKITYGSNDYVKLANSITHAFNDINNNKLKNLTSPFGIKKGDKFNILGNISYYILNHYENETPVLYNNIPKEISPNTYTARVKAIMEQQQKEELDQLRKEKEKKHQEGEQQKQRIDELKGENAEKDKIINHKDEEIEHQNEIIIKEKNAFVKQQKKLTDAQILRNEVDEVKADIKTLLKKNRSDILNDVALTLAGDPDLKKNIRKIKGDLKASNPKLSDGEVNYIISKALSENERYMKTVAANPDLFDRDMSNDTIQKENEQFQSKLRQQNLRYILPKFIERREKLVENTLNPNLLKGAFAI